MTVRAPFFPSYTQGQTLTPGAASAAALIGKGAKQLCITNLGSNVGYVRAGPAGVAATAADYPVPPGAQMNISKDEGYDTLAHISPLGTTFHVIPGEGY